MLCSSWVLPTADEAVGARTSARSRPTLEGRVRCAPMEAVCERVRRVAVICDDDHIVPDCDDHMSESHDTNALPWASVSVSIRISRRGSRFRCCHVLGVVMCSALSLLFGWASSTFSLPILLFGFLRPIGLTRFFSLSK